jgi:hypothetical protein
MRKVLIKFGMVMADQMARDRSKGDQNSVEETEQRLQKILQGAFSGPPTPLKDIPTRDGESRKLERKKPQRRLRVRSLS